MLVADICYGQTDGSLTCDKLPKLEIHAAEIFTKNSPFVIDFILSSTFECATVVFTHPARGTTGYHGSILSVTGSDVIALDFSISSDRKTVNVTECSAGVTIAWHLSAAQMDDNGAFFCIYHCVNNEMKDFGCASNNNGASPAEKEAVKMAKKVPNGDEIHDAKTDCPANKGCNTF